VLRNSKVTLLKPVVNIAADFMSVTMRRRFESLVGPYDPDLWPFCQKMGQCQLHARGRIYHPNMNFLPASFLNL